MRPINKIVEQYKAEGRLRTNDIAEPAYIKANTYITYSKDRNGYENNNGYLWIMDGEKLKFWTWFEIGDKNWKYYIG